MKIQSIVEVVTAAHLCYFVNSPKEFSARGGLMFVAPTGHLKTIITKTLDLWQPSAVVLSDLTIRQLVELRGDITTGRLRTLAFMELPKLYGRNQDTASNIEGALQQMADEGFRAANYEDQRLMFKEAKAMIVGAMPPDFYAKKWAGWIHGGWARRFLWCHFQLANPDIIMESIDRWEPLELGRLFTAVPATSAIPWNVTANESTFVRNILRRTKAGYEAVPYQMLKKIFCVIKWRYNEGGEKAASIKAMDIVSDFSQCLQQVADLEIELRPIGVEDKKPVAKSGTIR